MLDCKIDIRMQMTIGTSECNSPTLEPGPSVASGQFVLLNISVNMPFPTHKIFLFSPRLLDRFILEFELQICPAHGLLKQSSCSNQLLRVHAILVNLEVTFNSESKSR